MVKTLLKIIANRIISIQWKRCSNEICDSNTKTNSLSEDKTKGKEQSRDDSKQETNTQHRVYRI